MPAADEHQLILQVKEGNREAFRVLVESHMRQAYDVAFSILGSHDDADDTAQEAFVKVHRVIRTFRGESGFGTWLYRIVTNLSLNRLKQRKRQQRREVDLSIADQEMVQPSTQIFEGQEMKIYIERALHELPTLQRAVVMLRHMNGLSTRQVSKILECSEGTVKTHLYRGLQKMRERLQFLKEETI